MSSLLSLPRELRDEIVDHVISAYYSPAFERLAKEQRSPNDDRTPRSRWWGDPGDDYSSLLLYASLPNAHGLLLTNHQMHAETMQRLQAVKPDYVFHINVDGGGVVWPFWVRIPVLPLPVIDTVVARIEAYDFLDAEDDWAAVYYEIESSSSFGNMLDFMIGLGLPPPRHNDSARYHSVRNLVLDFRTQIAVSEQHDEHLYPLKGIKDADTVCAEVQRDFKKFLSGGFRGKKWFQNATRVFEKFGTIRFQVDGNDKEGSLDVADWLDYHNPTVINPRCIQRSPCKFIRETSEWYIAITEKREQAGLPVIKRSDGRT